jgi:hypothetical protein
MKQISLRSVARKSKLPDDQRPAQRPGPLARTVFGLKSLKAAGTIKPRGVPDAIL